MSRVYLNLGEINEEARKHRSAILVISVIMLVVDPHVTLTLGTASLAGLGISVKPPQSIPVGLFLYAVLSYRVIAFWAATIIGAGVNDDIARDKAIDSCDPGHYAEERNPHDIGHLINMETNHITYRWKVRRIYWDIFVPNLMAAFSLVFYSYRYIVTW